MSHFVKYEDIDNIRTITIDRPDRKNAINAGMLEEMCDFIKNAETNNMIRSIIITAQGDKVFSAGYDISSDSVNSKEDLLKIHLPDYQEKKHPLMKISDVITDSSKIIIAAINGHIYGGALEILLNCDFRFFSKESIFCMPPAKLGIVYNYYGLKNFINKIGITNTKKIFFTGNKFDANEAIDMGLVDFLSEKNTVLKDSIDFAKKISVNAPLSLASIKKSINAFEKNQEIDEKTCEEIKSSIIKTLDSNDYLEGQKAFKEKRNPKFSGK